MADTAPAGEDTTGYSNLYRYYALGLLTLVYILNFLDRQILSILLQPIKEDLGLSDSQLGFLTGFAFAIFYTCFAIPMARWADRGVRRSILALALGAWSLMTAASGLAVNYATLLAARIGVAVGESGGGPPSQSLIADYFPRHERSRAMSIYYLGLPLGILFGFLAGGWINEFFGWRTAFLVVGLPGVLVAILVRLTLDEPERGISDGLQAQQDSPSMGETITYLWQCRSYRHLTLGSALHAFVGYGIASWLPSFLIRSHGMGTGEVGTWLALITGGAGALGTLAGGIWAERLARRDERWYLWLPAIATLTSIPFVAFTYLWPNPTVALLVYIVPAFLGFFWSGPVHAVAQTVVRLRMRAMAAAGMLFVINLIGLGFGPQLVGVISDLLRPELGVHSLRWALVAVLPINVWCALHYWLGARTLRADLSVAIRSQ